MGGFFRAITRIFRQPAQQPAQVITTQAPISATKADRRPGQGSGVTGTIMTDSTGLEEEANVQKTVLGGETNTTKKKKKYA